MTIEKKYDSFSCKFYLTFLLDFCVVVVFCFFFKETATALGHFQLLYSHEESLDIYIS